MSHSRATHHYKPHKCLINRFFSNCMFKWKCGGIDWIRKLDNTASFKFQILGIIWSLITCRVLIAEFYHVDTTEYNKSTTNATKPQSKSKQSR